LAERRATAAATAALLSLSLSLTPLRQQHLALVVLHGSMGSVLSKAPDSSSLGAAVVAVVAGAAALRWWQRRRTHQRCRARITAKRQDVAGKLAAAASRWSLPADQAAAAAAVVSMSPTQLLSAMRDGTLSAEFVMRYV